MFSMDWIYLDNNATTRPLPEVVDAVTHAQQELWANPSSVHRFGQMVRQKVELARAEVAGLIGASPREVVFTSGGTESNNLALKGLWRKGWKNVLITTKTEHAAVREPALHLLNHDVEVRYADVDESGTLDVSCLQKLLDRCISSYEQALFPGMAVVVSVQWANNETGVIQPVERVAAAVEEARQICKDMSIKSLIAFHTDGTQAVGKLPVDVGSAGCDMMTFSGHKFHGPKGVGGLYLKRHVRLQTQQLGGPQEQERRGGTEPVPGILGMGVAASEAQKTVEFASKIECFRSFRDGFERVLAEKAPSRVVHGAHQPRLWNTSSVSFPSLGAEAILVGLSERGVCASAGAACSSGSLEPSPVLLAMGMDEAEAHGTVRFSTSRFTTEAELAEAGRAVVEVVERLGKVMGR